MSTNYYLVNKKEKVLRQKANEFINAHIKILKYSLIEFYEKNNIDIEHSDLEELFRDIENKLTDLNILEFKDFYLCKRIGKEKGGLDYVWNPIAYVEKDGEYVKLSNPELFRKFYEENNEEYEIRDEYDSLIIFEEFMEKIN